MKPFSTNPNSDAVKVHLTNEGEPIGRSVLALCGRTYRARAVWSEQAVDAFRNPRNSWNNCQRCFTASEPQ